MVLFILLSLEKNSSVSEAFEIFNAANKTCNNVEAHASIFENKRTRIINFAASKKAAINSSLESAAELLLSTRNVSEKIELESVGLKKRLSNANITLAKMNEIVFNSSQLLENTHSTGN